MKYGIVIRTRLNGSRVYGPYDAERAIVEFQQWEARVLASYEQDPHVDQPQQVQLVTFDVTAEEQRRAEMEALIKEKSEPPD